MNFKTLNLNYYRKGISYQCNIVYNIKRKYFESIL